MQIFIREKTTDKFTARSEKCANTLLFELDCGSAALVYLDDSRIAFHLD